MMDTGGKEGFPVLKRRDIGGRKGNFLAIFITSLLSGLLYFFSQPKYEIYPFAFLFVLPAHIYWRKTGDKKVFLLSGFFSFFFTVHWITHAITHYGGFPYIFALLPLSLLSFALGFFVFVFGFMRERISVWSRGKIPFAFIDPILWTALEYVKSFFLSGFPWALVGYSLWKKISLIQIADITGVYGVSFLVMSFSGLLCDIYDFLSGKKSGSRNLNLVLSSIIFPFLLLFISVIYGFFRMKEVKAILEQNERSIPAVVVQPSIPQDVKWTETLKKRYLTININLTFSALDKSYDRFIAVWPETALTFYLELEPAFKDELISLAKKGIYIIAGGLGYERENSNGGIEEKYFNRAYFITDEAKIYHYDKTHLVIFGEYIPLRGILERIPLVKKIIHDVEKVAGDFTPGKEIKPVGDKLKVAVPICFESIFPDIVRKMVKGGAELIAVITNDGWFGLSSGPYQHFSASAFRAVETRRFVLRSANTGISGAFSPLGEVIAQTELLERTSFVTPVKLLNIKTFYTEYGDVFAISCLALSLFAFSITYIPKRDRKIIK